MKKLVFGLVAILLFSNSSFSQEIEIKLLSKTILKAGVSSIISKTTPEKNVNYTVKTFKHFYFGSKKINMNQYSLLKSGNTYRLIDSKNEDIFNKYSVVVDNQITISTSEYTGLIQNIGPNLYDDENMLVMMLLVNELEGNPGDLISFEEFSNSSGGCSFWDTTYAIGFGLNAAAAESHLTHVIKQAAADHRMDNCTDISTTYETTCTFGGCYSTFAFCCK